MNGCGIMNMNIRTAALRHEWMRYHEYEYTDGGIKA